MVKKTRRMVGYDLYIWEVIHWFTMVVLRHRITRGYSLDTGKLVRVYWDRTSNWSSIGEDWHRLDVPYPTPIWRSKEDV